MMKILRRIIKILTWLFVIIFTMLIILGGVLFFGIQPYINKHLSEYISEETNGLYQFNFEKIELKFKNRELIISNLNLSHNKQIAEEIQRNNPDKVFYSFSSPGLEIDKFNIREMLFDKNVYLKSISIIHPKFELTGPELFGKDSVQVFEYALNEIKPVFNKFINDFKIDTIEFVDANYQFFNIIGDSTRASNADNISVGISGFRTDSVLLLNTKKPFTTEDIFVRITGLKNELSDSIHFMEIDSLEYSLKKSELKAFRFKLYPFIKTGLKSRYNVYVPEFYMRSRNLSGFNLSDTLDVSFLEFENPELIFTKKDNPKKLNIDDINNFDLYELVKNDFKIINIDSFYLNNASLKIFNNISDSLYQQKFNNLDIHLINFNLDSLSNKNTGKLLYADDIEMRINDYELNLDDDLHMFSADSIYVSTFADSIGISGITIDPTQNLKKNSSIVLNINCQQLIIDNVDLKRIYHQRIIPGSTVEIINPKVLIDNYPDFQKYNKQSGLLFDLVGAYLKGVYSNLIHIENGSLNIKNYAKGKTTEFFESDFTFSLTDFSLDSSSINRTDKFFYATNFDLNFSNYKMQLTDNLHKLDVKNINISSTESTVTIDSLHLYPAINNIGEDILKEYNQSELYDILLPRITLQNTNLHRAFFENKLNISDFNIYNPQISYENYATLKIKKKKQEFSELYELIFDYVNDISISRVAIPKGTIKWINHSKTGKTITLDNTFSTELKKFRLNSNELNKQNLIFSEHIRFSLKDQLFKLSDNIHYLQAGQIDFSTEDRSIVINDALLYPDITSPEYLKKPTTVQVTIPKLKFDNIDLVDVYYSRKIDVGDILFTNPKLEVYSQTNRIKTLDLKKFSIPLPKLIESFKVKRLNINNGQVISYITDGTFKTQSSSFKLDLDSKDITLSHGTGNSPNIIESEDITTKLSDFQLVFYDKSHEVRFDNLTYKKRQENIELSNFRIIPSKYGQSENTLMINVPFVELLGFNIDRAYENNYYIFEKIGFNSPIVKVTTNDTITSKGVQKLKDIDLYNYLEPYFNTLEIGELTLANAGVDLKSEKTELVQNNINISVKNITIGKDQPKNNLLNSDGFEFSTFNYSHIPDDSDYIFSIDTLTYSSILNRAELGNINIKPLYSKEEIAARKGFQTDVANAKIRSVILDGFNFDSWIEDGAVIGSLLTIGPSEVNIFRNKRYLFNKEQRPLWPQQLLTKIKQPFSVDSIILLPSIITYSELLESDDEPVEINFTNISVYMGKLSNISEHTNKYFRIKASGNILQSAKLNANINFDLESDDFSHQVSGNLSPLKMTLFNDIIEKNALLTIENGYVNKFDFNFRANDKMSSGELQFKYDDLKIAVMDYRKGNTKKSKFNSFMANSFIINSKNPKGKVFTPEVINYHRDPSRSVLNYWWKSIYTGAKITLGVKDNE